MVHFLLAALCAMRYKQCIRNAQYAHNAKCKQMLNTQQAQQYLQQHANAQFITAQQVQALLANASVTFASIAYVTQVQTAAAHKHNNVQKVTVANVQLFANIRAATQVFANVQQFTQQSNYFTHTQCYSIVQHKQTQAQYLYAIYNNAQSVYFINNVVATKQQVAQLLTASAAQKLLQNDNTVHNKTHNVQVRTVALNNIVSIVANKQQLTV